MIYRLYSQNHFLKKNKTRGLILPDYLLAIRLCKIEKHGTGKKIDKTYMEQNVESKSMNTLI